MPSTSETGHVKNVANFQQLISYCIGYGTQYNPSNEALKIDSLQTILNAAQSAIANCTILQTNYANAVDTKQDAFANIKTLTTKVVNALAVSGVPQSVVEDAKSINRKMQGKRAGKLLTANGNTTGTDAPPAHKNISVAQLSYDNVIDHFNSLIQLVISHPEYNPNEADLKVAALQTRLNELTAVNNNAIDAHTALSNGRINRDETLYATPNGLVDTAQNVKNYVKSLFGSTSPRYAEVKGLAFKNR